MIKQSIQSLKNSLSKEGISFKTFSLYSEGRFSFLDADWNYKDIPHLHYVHDLVESHISFADHDIVTNISFQKIPPIFRIPITITNYDYDENTQIYYTSFLFYILLVETKIIKIKENFTKVQTTYNIGSTSKFFLIFFPILKFIIKRNYKDLMSGDIPMRLRRGDLREVGYDIIKKFPDKKVSFTETIEILKKHVVIPKKFKKTYKFKVSKNLLIKEKDLCIGKSDDRGLRLKLENNKIYVFSRICDHQGADLSCAKYENKHLMCPWHGKRLSALCVLDLKNISYTGNNISVTNTSDDIIVNYKVS